MQPSQSSYILHFLSPHEIVTEIIYNLKYLRFYDAWE